MTDIKLSFSLSFQIAIENVTDDNELFYSVDGLSMFYNLNQKYQGGENIDTMVATTLKTTPLVVKRPLTNIITGFSKWCTKSLESGVFTPVSMNIFILGRDNEINNHWVAEEAYPYGMKVSSINIEHSDFVIMEEIFILYRKLMRIK